MDFIGGRRDIVAKNSFNEEIIILSSGSGFYHRNPFMRSSCQEWRTRLFSSTDLENIRVGYERPPWGFWDREAGEKQRRNWRSFVKARHKKGKRL